LNGSLLAMFLGHFVHNESIEHIPTFSSQAPLIDRNASNVKR